MEKYGYGSASTPHNHVERKSYYQNIVASIGSLRPELEHGHAIYVHPSQIRPGTHKRDVLLHLH